MSNQMPSVNGEYGQKPTLEFASSEAPEGLQISVLKEGEGREITAGALASVHYLGCLWGGSVFDNSYDRREPLTFPVGIGQVIRGWDQGLLGQRVGSRLVLSIPAEMAYGERGVPQAGIPGGATLVFVCDIMDVC